MMFLSDKTTEREGASLVLVLVAVALLTSLSLGAVALVRSRTARVHSRAERFSLHDMAENALFLALWRIEADTNKIDSLAEPWAVQSLREAERMDAGNDGVFVLVSDERARLGIPHAGERPLAALISRRTGLDAASAAGAASVIFSGLRELSEDTAAAPNNTSLSSEVPSLAGMTSTNLVIGAEERLFDLPSAPAEILSSVLPFVSVSAGDRINVNTVGHDVFCALALASGATQGGAEGVWTRLEMSRDRGDVFQSTAQSEALKLLRGEGDVPSPEEIAALQAVQNRLRVDSNLFRVRAIACRAGRTATIECVYERGSRNILRWMEL